MKPKLYKDVPFKLKERKERRRKHYDSKAKDVCELKPGSVVRIRPDPNDRSKVWRKASVIRKVARARSYIVRTENAGEYRRNRLHLRVSSEQWEDEIEFDLPDNSSDNWTSDVHVSPPVFIRRSNRVTKSTQRPDEYVYE